MNKGIIYSLTWPTGEVYIGKTKRISSKRRNEHINTFKNKKYKFMFTEIDRSDIDKLDDIEEYWINSSEYRGRIINKMKVHDFSQNYRPKQSDINNELNIIASSSLMFNQKRLLPSYVIGFNKNFIVNWPCNISELEDTFLDPIKYKEIVDNFNENLRQRHNS